MLIVVLLQVIDPGACSGTKNCPGDDCSSLFPQALYAHRCMGTWRRAGDA